MDFWLFWGLSVLSHLGGGHSGGGGGNTFARRSAIINESFIKREEMGPVETGMNRTGSLPIHENLTLYDRLPPQGLWEARWGNEFFEFCLPIRRWGDPSGAAAIIVSEGESDSNARIISEYLIFMGNSITPQTGNTSLSQSEGAVWGDRHCPLRLLARASYFILN